MFGNKPNLIFSRSFESFLLDTNRLHPLSPHFNVPFGAMFTQFRTGERCLRVCLTGCTEQGKQMRLTHEFQMI